MKASDSGMGSGLNDKGGACKWHGIRKTVVLLMVQVCDKLYAKLIAISFH